MCRRNWRRSKSNLEPLVRQKPYQCHPGLSTSTQILRSSRLPQDDGSHAMRAGSVDHSIFFVGEVAGLSGGFADHGVFILIVGHAAQPDVGPALICAAAAFA